MKYRAVLFDLDGTLSDPYEGVVNGFRFTLEKFGIKEEDEKKLRTFIGPPLELTFSDAYAFSQEDTKRAIGIFRGYYAEKGVYENKLYEGIPELLSLLKSQGRSCMVATSKAEHFAVQVLDHFGIHHFFDDVAGAMLDESRSDKAEVIAYLVLKHHLNKDSTIMVGDRIFDIAGSGKNGIGCIAVAYGHGGEDELMKAKPLFFCRDINALKDFFLKDE